MDIGIIKEILNQSRADKLLNYFIQKKFITKEELKKTIMNSNDAELIYQIAINDILQEIARISLKQLEQLICETKNYQYIFYFARDVNGADIDFLTKEICKMNKVEYIYRFSTTIGEANVIDLGNAICKSKDPEYIYFFARNRKNFPLDVLEEAILDCKNLEFIKLFAENVLKTSSDKFEDAIISLANPKSSLTGHYILLYAMEVPNANIDKMTTAICKTNSGEYIYRFARNIKNANVKKLVEGICKTGNAEYIFQFATNIELNKEDISRLQDAIIKTEDGEYILKFAEYVQNVDIKKIEDAIVKIKNPEYLYSFSQLEGANITRIQDEIIKTGSAKYILKFTNYFENDERISIEKLENAIIETKNYEEIMHFISLIVNCNLSKFENVVMESNNTLLINKYKKICYSTAKSISEQLNTYTSKQKLDLLKLWIKEEQFILINCYGKYILSGMNDKEKGKVCDQLYEEKIMNIGLKIDVSNMLIKRR